MNKERVMTNWVLFGVALGGICVLLANFFPRIFMFLIFIFFLVISYIISYLKKKGLLK